MIYELDNTKGAEKIFGNWQESLIWSCLQKVMGRLFGDDPEQPRSAMALLGDFCFVAGAPDRELVSFRPQGCAQDFLIMVPENEDWAALIEEEYGCRAKRVTRYGIKKEGHHFDKDKLEAAIAALPSGYCLRMIDEELYRWCLERDWCRDMVAQYEDYEAYRSMGLGVMVLKDGEPVSGASSYSSFNGGIEIEIGTRPEHRRKGLAYACGARLILECQKRGWYPSWDAQNLWSVGLAQKLGYVYDHEYAAYEITGWAAPEARLDRQFDFIREIDKEKFIGRQTYLTDGVRKENDAEHAWHLGLMTILLSEYSNEPIDVLKTVAMVLIHDIVEIDAGDTYAYDEEGKKTQREREVKAAERIFRLLPADQARKLRGLWDEFEEYRTPEAKFAHAMDNLQPNMLNAANGGMPWAERNVRLSQILERNRHTAEGSEVLWQYMQEHFINPNVEKGNIIS